MAWMASHPHDKNTWRRKQLCLATALLWIILIFFLEFGWFLWYALLCREALEESMASSASPDGGHSGWSRILLVGDMHVLGYRRHPADVLWSDWGLVKLLGVAVSVLKPEVVAMGGDMFDEGNSCKDEELALASRRFRAIVQALGIDVIGDGGDGGGGGGGGGGAGLRPLLMTLGNHDVGLGWQAKKEKIERALRELWPGRGVGELGNWVSCWRNISIVGYNTQVLSPSSDEGLRRGVFDFVRSKKTQSQITKCSGEGSGATLVLQHMPMFRESDAVCGMGDDSCLGQGVGLRGRPDYCRTKGGGVTFKGRHEKLGVWHDEVMDQETSHLVLSALSPTLLISAHTHAPCIRKHALAPNTPSLDTGSDNSDEVKKDSMLRGQSTEVTLPTVAWRMRPDPGYVVAALPAGGGAQGVYALAFCGAPNEHNVFKAYAAGGTLTALAWSLVAFWPCFARGRIEGGGVTSSGRTSPLGKVD